MIKTNNKVKKSGSYHSHFHLYDYTVSQKNDTDVAYYNFNAHQPQPIFVIFLAETLLREYTIER